MAIYHDIEEIFYGSDLGMTPVCRVLLCLRHKLLRDGLCQKSVGRKFIMDATGLNENQVNRSIKTLEKKKIILVHRIKKGKQWLSSEYELNPEVFGTEYNWYKNNPTVRVYNGSKIGSYSKKGVLPKSEGVPLPITEGGVPLKRGGATSLSLAELLEISASKNPSSRTHINNPSSENLNFPEKREPKKQRTQAEHEAIIREQVAMAKAGKL